MQLNVRSFDAYLTTLAHVLPTTSHQPHHTNHITPTTSHQPHHTNHITPTTSHQPHHTNHITPTTSHQPHHTNHITPTTSHQPHHTNHITPTTSHQPHHTNHIQWLKYMKYRSMQDLKMANLTFFYNKVYIFKHSGKFYRYQVGRKLEFNVPIILQFFSKFYAIEDL